MAVNWLWHRAEQHACGHAADLACTCKNKSHAFNEELSGVLHSDTQSYLRLWADGIQAALARGEAICMGCAAAAELFHELSAVLTAAYSARLFLAREMTWVTCIYGVE